MDGAEVVVVVGVQMGVESKSVVKLGSLILFFFFDRIHIRSFSCAFSPFVPSLFSLWKQTDADGPPILLCFLFDAHSWFWLQ